MSTIPTDSRSHSAYFIIAYAFSWAIGVPLALGATLILAAFWAPWHLHQFSYGFITAPATVCS